MNCLVTVQTTSKNVYIYKCKYRFVFFGGNCKSPTIAKEETIVIGIASTRIIYLHNST